MDLDNNLWKKMKSFSYGSYDPNYKPSIASDSKGLKTIQHWESRLYTLQNNLGINLLPVHLAVQLVSSSLPNMPIYLTMWCEEANKHFDQTFLQGEIRTRLIFKSIELNKTKRIIFCMRLVEQIDLQNKFIRHTETLLTNDYDVCLRGNEWKYKAHRQILSDASPVFAAMFQHDMTESSDGNVNIKDADGPSILALLTYIYTGRIDPNTNIDELYKLADKYQMEDLKSAWLDQPITISNCLTYLNLCQVYDLVDFEQKCLVFIKMNLEEVSETEEWGRLQQQSSILSSINQQLRGLII